MKARNEEPRHACGFLRLRRLRSGLSRDTLSQCEKRKRLRGVATARTRPRSPPPLGGWETHFRAVKAEDNIVVAVYGPPQQTEARLRSVVRRNQSLPLKGKGFPDEA
jgi:hypothetical protein